MSSPIIDRVGGIVTSVAIKAPCRVVTATNVPLHGLQTIDDIPLAEGDRVLVAAQSDARQNGIYVASSGVWQRSYDFNSPRDHVRGTRVLVVEGETFGYREFWLSSRGLNIGADPVEWEMVITGPMGPQGPQGPQGPEGPQGPPVSVDIAYVTDDALSVRVAVINDEILISEGELPYPHITLELVTP